MTMSSLFEELNAPLNNRMWSWGAVREADKTVFLRVWQDGTKKYNELGGKYYTWVSDVQVKDMTLGAIERRRHVDLIKEGYRVFMIMCEVQDEDAVTRGVKDFNDEQLFEGGVLIEHDGMVLLENVGRVMVRDIRSVKT